MNSPVPTPQTSTLAVVSLVMGIISWFVLPLLGPIVAVITGHMARGEIRRSPTRIEGDGMAIAGLILGYLQLALIVLGLIVVVLFFGGLAAVIALAQ